MWAWRGILRKSGRSGGREDSSIWVLALGEEERRASVELNGGGRGGF